MAAKVTSWEITRWATWEFTGWPMNIIRFLNNMLERSNGPPGVIIAGIMGGLPFLATIGPLLEQNGKELSENVPSNLQGNNQQR